MRRPGEPVPTPEEMRWALANVHRTGGIGGAFGFLVGLHDHPFVDRVNDIARRCDFHPDELNGELAGAD